MCGTLKYEGTSKKIGKVLGITVDRNQNAIAIRSDGSHIIAQWLGFVRSESGLPKLPHEIVHLPAKVYYEQGVPFSVPPGKAIKAFLVNCKNYPTGKGIFIITRNATPEELKRCKHPRHPLLVNFD